MLGVEFVMVFFKGVIIWLLAMPFSMAFTLYCYVYHKTKNANVVTKCV